MTQKNSASVLMIGGPDSGKSNFLFRTWLTIDGGGGLITENGLPSQLEYLKQGSKELLLGDFAQRTQHDVYTESVIPVKALSVSPPLEGELVVPDCWGERWMEIYRKREWSQRWEQHFEEGTGCLIFLRASSDQNVAPLDWVQCEQRWGAPLGDGEEAGSSPVPTQVIVVEWLQFLRATFSALGLTGQRVGIVISAWDKVPDDRKADGPLRYLEVEYPLLHQFINAADGMTLEVFASSIAGGDLADEPGFKERCLQQSDPLSGGYVLAFNGTQYLKRADFTLPVAWAMGAIDLTHLG